jgi:outer membrane protein OmpA-like peptidoglycan-associated protein
MGEPEDRAAGAGTLNVRIDNVKEQSWVSVNGEEGPLGQMFFSTSSHTLDSNDAAMLEYVAKQYEADMRLNPGAQYTFYMFGYADHRDIPMGNLELSRERSEAVENTLRSHLGIFPNYEAVTEGMGVDKNDPKRSLDSKTLSRFRRVDIIGPKLRGTPKPDPPPPPTPPAPPKLSRKWKARMKKSGSAAAAIFQGDHFYMDIVDLTNMLTQEFVYKGLGFGLSPIPVGLSYSPSPSDWKEFETRFPLSLSDLEGFAFHTSVQVQLSFFPGGTGDIVLLTCAHSRRMHDWVRLWYKGFTNIDKDSIDPNAGLGAAQTGGTLEPTGGAGVFDPMAP